MKTVIFDIDGTLADLTHRLHHINGARRWDKFFADCMNDSPIEPVIELNKMVAASGAHILLVSGRSDIVRSQTEEWLRTHGVIWNQLFMRKDGDSRPDDIVKEEFLDQFIAAGHQILFTVDDRQRVVDMWRRRGLVCLQAAAWVERKKETIRISKGLLILMVGPSGAGKSQWLLGRMEAGYISPNSIISSDQIRKELCGDFRDQTKNTQVFTALHAIAKARIDSGLPAVIDATNIKRADRMACVALAEGSPVKYIVIDRPLQDKFQTAGWRNEVPGLIERHHQTFRSQIKDVLRGDDQPNVSVLNLCNYSKSF